MTPPVPLPRFNPRSERRQKQVKHLVACGERCVLEALIAVDDGQPLDLVLRDFERLSPRDIQINIQNHSGHNMKNTAEKIDYSLIPVIEVARFCLALRTASAHLAMRCASPIAAACSSPEETIAGTPTATRRGRRYRPHSHANNCDYKAA